MQSLTFEEANAEIGKGQEKDYQVLHANIDPTKRGMPVTFFMGLDLPEVDQIVAQQGIWLQQHTNGNLFQPISLSISKPTDLVKIDLEQYRAKEQPEVESAGVRLPANGKVWFKTVHGELVPFTFIDGVAYIETE